MKLEDVIYNWLQITVVSEARPDDRSAKETSDFFGQILTDDHHVSNIRYERDSFMYKVYFEKEGKNEEKQFALALVDKLLEDIENEPKYNQ